MPVHSAILRRSDGNYLVSSLRVVITLTLEILISFKSEGAKQSTLIKYEIFSTLLAAYFFDRLFRARSQVKILINRKLSWMNIVKHVGTEMCAFCIAVVFLISRRVILQHTFPVWITILITVVFMIHSCLVQKNYEFSIPERQELCESLELNVGSGAALIFYFNYLKHILTETLKTRICHFETKHQVKIFKKLIILIPHSCHVKKYIDETEGIERARELLPYEFDFGGIKNRVYNITVYRIQLRREYWCAIEYAQPLKQIWDLRKNGKITETEMQQERQMFVQTLDHLLQKEDCECCLLWPYNDLHDDHGSILVQLQQILSVE